MPSANEMRQLGRELDAAAQAGTYRRNMRWFNEYERLLEQPGVWEPEKAAGLLQSVVALLLQKGSKARAQKRVSTAFYCLAILAKAQGISPRAIVNVEPIDFSASSTTKDTKGVRR